MTRERWFYAEGHRRMGPVSRRDLVEALHQLTDPRTCLIWRRGLQAWTPASDVSEIDRLLTPFSRSETPVPALARGSAAPPVDARRPVSARPIRPRPPASRGRQGRTLLYAAAVLAVGIGVSAWVWWPRPASPVLPAGQGSPSPDAPRTPVSGAVATPDVPAAGGGRFTGWADEEADLPPGELSLLRGVGGWAGDKLTITIYNASSWRVTEIFVLTSRMEGDRFVDAVLPQLLLPVGGAPLEGAVQDLLQKVAPDRKRAGVNPSDTGPFEGVLGPRPAAFRWKIDRARGYPPRIAP